ncbi:ArsC/Spx/MgsR family protein [Desulfogranum japonicum]|uniref:ArsC/Spx/MgsR family protein n=1 Tax=Desulfogranum japonicum TaxID=231447 RepID=UPI0003F7A8E3|nr:ArsC/Spx/MgsR family protein [Desulfogranum japonicum]
MANIVFFEKPGCINGEKQKKILSDADNKLDCINILQHAWTADKLLPFVIGKSPSTMINHTAPAVKNGQIKPTELSFDEAISLMIADPILIKRPLIIVDNLHIQGFDDSRLSPYQGSWNSSQDDVMTCPNLHTLSCDDQKTIK